MVYSGMLNSKGQNVIEYVILIAAVMVVVIGLFISKNFYKTSLENSVMGTTVKMLEKTRDEIKF